MQSAFKEKVLKLFESFPKMDKMGFLASFFKTSEEDYTDAEYIDIDIVRSGEQVAPVLRDISNGAIAIADATEDVHAGPRLHSVREPCGRAPLPWHERHPFGTLRRGPDGSARGGTDERICRRPAVCARGGHPARAGIEPRHSRGDRRGAPLQGRGPRGDSPRARARAAAAR